MEKVNDILSYHIVDMLHFKSSIAFRNDEEAAKELLNWTSYNSACNCLGDAAVFLIMAVLIFNTCVQKPRCDASGDVIVDKI